MSDDIRRSIFLYNKKHKQEIYAFLFGVVLGVIFLSALVIAFNSTGPIIIGTEMNTNGMVEYMCLGNGCEEVLEFSWNDH